MKLVETIDYLVQELFTINFSHSGFDDLRESMISDNLVMRPDEETEIIFRNYNIGYSFTNNIFVCYIQSYLLAPPASQPRAAFIIPANDTRFRFLLKASSHFMNTTIINPVTNGHAYYFSNRVNTGTNMFISHDAAEVNNNDLSNITEVNIRDTYLAVIDIFSSGAVNNNYELFTGTTGRLRSPEYRLLFRSGI